MKHLVAVCSLLLGLVVATVALVANPAPVAAVTPTYETVTPTRVADTRPGYPDYGPAVAKGLTVDGGTIRIPVAGRAGVRSDATAVAINLTATQATSRGYLTVYACDAPVPNTSNVNLQPGNPVANLVFSKISAAGDICIFTRGTTHLIVDLVGFVPNRATPDLITPTRVADTRPAYGDYGTPSVSKRLTADGGIIRIPVAGRAGVPTDAAAVMINLTATQATSRGYLTVYACNTASPNTSNVNLQDGNPVANLVVTKIDTNGDICILTRGTTHLIVDLVGFVPKGATPILTTPTRVGDTRPENGDFDSPSVPKGLTTDGGTIRIPVAGRAGVPADATAVAINLTATQSTSRGYLTVYACDTPLPNTSNVNLQVGNPVANLVVTKIGAAGDICIFTRGTTHLIVDIDGYVPDSKIVPPTTSSSTTSSTTTSTTVAPKTGCTIDGVDVTTDLDQTTCDALIALHQSTTGAIWKDKTGWNTATDPCSWYGLTCANKQLTEIELRNNQLYGKLPDQIGNLTDLTVLDVSFNDILDVPGTLENLTKVSVLDLSGTTLTAVPAATVKLTNLTDLDLSYNEISNVPAEIGNLTNLTILNLSHNQAIATIPPEIGNLTNLTALNFYNNRVSAIPTEIGNLTKLTSLNLGANEITVIPAEIGNLTNLTYLDLDANQISTVPTEIANLSNLTTLIMWGNQFTTFPTEITNLTNLTRLDFTLNQLTAIPPEIGNLTNLTELNLSVNKITVIPAEIGKLTNLTKLNLFDNQIATIPAEVGSLTNLTDLNLGANAITTIPPEIGNLTNLNDLSLTINKIATIPPEIGKLTKLERLGLAYNRLTGDVSAAFGPLAAANTITSLSLKPGSCITASDPAVQTWLAGFNPDWAAC